MTDDLDTLKVSAANAAARRFGTMLVEAIGVAAEIAPDLLRHALGKVFDLTQIEADHRRIASAFAEQLRVGQDIRELYWSIQKQLEDADKIIDGLRHEVACLRRELRARKHQAS